MYLQGQSAMDFYGQRMWLQLVNPNYTQNVHRVHHVYFPSNNLVFIVYL